MNDHFVPVENPAPPRPRSPESLTAGSMIDWLSALIRSREMLFRNYEIESIAHYRQLKENRDPVCDRFGDVFLIIDGWPSLIREFETVETSVAALAAEGLSYGVHVVLSASRWAEIDR